MAVPQYYKDARGRRRRARSAAAGVIALGLKDAAVDRAREVAQEVVDILHARSDPRKTGDLLKDYKVVRDSDGVRIVNPNYYWFFQEFGTRTKSGEEWTPATHMVRDALETVRAAHRGRRR